MSSCAPTGPQVARSRHITDYAEKVIPPTQATVGDLEIWKAESSGLTGTHEAAISPLRSFPPELLAEIFAQFIDMMMNYGLTPVPLMLMGICSQWRRIVLDTPRLWTKILTLHPMIDSWISRSKALPLYLDLDLPRPASDPIMEALIPHSHRWEYVDFSIASSSNSVLTRVRTHLHSLRQLTLYFSDTTGTVDFCEVAPQLTQIDLVDILEPVVIKLPWEQLKVCTLDNAEIAHYVLQHAKNLRILRLDIAYEAPEPPSLMSRGPHSYHLGLNTLNLQWNHFAPEIDVNSFFSSITLPSLRTLKVHFSCLDPEDTTQFTDFDTNRAELAPILAGFFERSCTHLSTLTLTDIPFSQSGLIQCLAFAPSLVSLDVQFDGYWYAIKSKLLHRLDANHPEHILPTFALSHYGGQAYSLKSSLMSSSHHGETSTRPMMESPYLRTWPWSTPACKIHQVSGPSIPTICV
ncbi:hypothetical protein BD779DRAFT_1473887 [Infundibulicybe gibba]|nr:hypothetical protein BD779DRAFT_1473887 [Infundibulicybe gibba]